MSHLPTPGHGGFWFCRDNQSINQLINPSSFLTFNQSINLSIYLSINHLINQSINQSIIQSFNQSINQPIYQSVNQSLNQSNNTSITQLRRNPCPNNQTVINHHPTFVQGGFCLAMKWVRHVHHQSWALSVFLSCFTNKKTIFCIFYQVNLTGSGLFK